MGKKAGPSGADRETRVVYPTCVRHAQPRKDVKLRHFFLCDPCTRRWVQDAFADSEPFTYGEPIGGCCLLCNSSTQVRLRTWFLCDICDRVARSIGRNHVAEQAILDYWEQQVCTRYPHLRIRQNDPSSLRPRRKSDVSGEGPLDFLVTDERTGQIVFGIENKTGRSSIREMSQFQLDVSDCESILRDVLRLAVPAYVIHAQVLEVWEPPTMGFRAVGLWWSDVFRLAENFATVRMRPVENRGVAYYKRAAFAPINTLGDDLYEESGDLRLVSRFRREGIPRLYRDE